MANEYKHKRYFKQYNNSTSSYVTFSDVSDAQTKIGFGSCFDTNSPTKTYTLEDAGQTLVVTYTHSSEANQISFKSAVDAAWTNDSIFTGNTITSVEPFVPVLEARHVKTEWLDENDSVGATTNFEF
jgi:hypothetical protein